MSHQKEDKVVVTLKGAGITFEAEVSALTAVGIQRLCLTAGQENQDSNTSAPLSVEPILGDGKVSLGEYVHKHEPTSYPEKILAIAAYQKEFKGREAFSPEDIRPLFRTIGDVPPANFGRDFRIAISNSWIASDDQDPNVFYVTSAGLRALKSNFRGESIKKQKIRKRRRNAITAGQENGQ